MRSLSTFLTEGAYGEPAAIKNLYVQPTWLEFRYNGVPVNIDLFDIDDKIFPCTKKTFEDTMSAVEQLIIDTAGDDVMTAPNWDDTMSAVRAQLESFYVKTKREITEVHVDEFDVILAYEGEIVSFNLIRYEDEPFPTEESAIAFVEGQLKPFKAARNYKKVRDHILLVMDDYHYWESED